MRLCLKSPVIDPNTEIQPIAELNTAESALEVESYLEMRADCNTSLIIY